MISVSVSIHAPETQGIGPKFFNNRLFVPHEFEFALALRRGVNYVLDCFLFVA
jgi:hypothetical protein